MDSRRQKEVGNPMPVYELECKECGKQGEWYSPLPTDENLPCPHCGGETERLYSLYKPNIFEPFTTRNILPDGEPVTVRGTGQLAQLENEHKVTLADDPGMEPPQTTFHKPDLRGKPPDWWKGRD